MITPCWETSGAKGRVGVLGKPWQSHLVFNKSDLALHNVITGTWICGRYFNQIWKSEVNKKLLNLGGRRNTYLTHVCRLLQSIERLEKIEEI